jgi:hypothetical protein
MHIRLSVAPSGRAFHRCTGNSSTTRCIMSYKFITEIDHRDTHEIGDSGPRQPFLESLAEDIRNATAVAKRLTREGPGQPPAGGTIQAIKQFHENAARHAQRIAAANAQVIHFRKWLERMGGRLDQRDRLDWAKSVKTVSYDAPIDQGFTKVRMEGGLVLWERDRTRVDTSEMVTAFSGPGKAIYALSATNAGPGGGLHISSHSVGARHHSSLLAASQQWIAGAGEIEVRRGIIRSLSNKSGHYQPNLYHFLQVLHHLEKNHILLDFAVTFFPGGARYASVHEFMTANGLDDDSYDYFNLIHAYNTQMGAPGALEANGWEFRLAGVGTPQRPEKPGVYRIGSNVKIPSHEVRHWLHSVQHYHPVATEHGGATMADGGTRGDD